MKQSKQYIVNMSIVV